MTLSSPADSHVHFGEHEVALLVDMVRLSRVTLLLAEQDSGKSGLLQGTVMPLLSGEGDGGSAEIAILFDAWEKAPLPALLARIRQAAGARVPAGPLADPGSLVESLRAWQEALDVTFLIIFDRFEEYLRAPPHRAGVAEFEESLVQVVNDPALRANFLLAFDDEAEPLLARLRDRIPRLGYSRIRLPRASPATQAPSREQDAPTEPPRASQAAPAEPRDPQVPQPEASPPSPPYIAPITPTVRAGASERDADPSRRTESSIVAAVAALRSHAQQSAAGPKPPEQAPQAVSPAAAEATSQTRAEPKVVEATPPMRAEPKAAEVTSQMRAEPKAAEVTSQTRAKPKAAEAKPPVQVTNMGTSKDPVAAASQTVARTKAAEVGVRPPAPPQLTRPEHTAAPKRGFARFAWASLMLIPAVLFFFWEPKSQQPAERVPSPPPQETAVVASRGDPAPAPEQKVAAPAAPLKLEEGLARLPSPELSSALQAAPDAASVPRTVMPEIAPPNVPPAPPGQPASGAPAVPSSRGEIATPKPATAASKPPAATVPATQPVRKPEVTAGKPAAVTPAPPLAAGAPVQRSAQPEIVARAPSAAPAQPASGDAAAGPALRIYVRSEAQRAWAEALIRPLNERGIRVAGIKVVPSGPEEADIRYYRLTERSEALKVAVALRDFGLGAQRLRQMEEPETSAPVRQYELWLPATGYDQRR